MKIKYLLLVICIMMLINLFKVDESVQFEIIDNTESFVVHDTVYIEKPLSSNAPQIPNKLTTENIVLIAIMTLVVFIVGFWGALGLWELESKK